MGYGGDDAAGREMGAGSNLESFVATQNKERKNNAAVDGESIWWKRDHSLIRSSSLRWGILSADAAAACWRSLNRAKSVKKRAKKRSWCNLEHNPYAAHPLA